MSYAFNDDKSKYDLSKIPQIKISDTIGNSETSGVINSKSMGYVSFNITNETGITADRKDDLLGIRSIHLTNSDVFICSYELDEQGTDLHILLFVFNNQSVSVAKSIFASITVAYKD